MIAATPKEAIKIRRFIFASRFRTSAALSRHSPDARVEKGHGLPVDALWQRVSSAIGRCRQPSDVVPSGGVESGGLAFIRTQLSHCRLSLSTPAPLMPVLAAGAAGRSGTGCQQTTAATPHPRPTGT